MEDLAFVACAILSVTSALAGVMNRGTPVYSAAALLPMLLGIAFLFVLLSAPFVAAMQVALYGGAIIVLFLFAVMTMNSLGDENHRRSEKLWEWLIGAILGGCLIGILSAFVAIAAGRARFPVAGKQADGDFGSVALIGGIMLKDLIVPFELISVLIVVALVGAVLVLGRDFWRDRWDVRGAAESPADGCRMGGGDDSREFDKQRGDET